MIQVETKYNPIPNELYYNYMDMLVNRIFKILPLKDEKSKTVDTYIINLLNELTGNKELIIHLNNDSRYETILANLQALLATDADYRNIVLNTIPLIKQLKEQYCE